MLALSSAASLRFGLGATENQMRKTQTALLAGIAAAAVIGFAGLAEADGSAVHTMTVRLPGGDVETIRYTGDVAPRVVVVPTGADMPAAFMPPELTAFDRIQTAMDRQMTAMMEGMRAMPMVAMPNMNQLMQAAARNGGGSFCAQSMSITSSGNGQPAKVVTHSVGNCGGPSLAPNGSDNANDMQAVPDAPKTIPIKSTAPALRPVRQHI
jgi:hypothetical protein